MNGYCSDRNDMGGQGNAFPDLLYCYPGEK